MSTANWPLEQAMFPKSRANEALWKTPGPLEITGVPLAITGVPDFMKHAVLQDVQVKSFHTFCLIFPMLNITPTKIGIVESGKKWHNGFSISSVTPRLGCPSAAFGVNDPV